MSYGKTPPTPVSAERFDEMLNVLPPSRWYRGERTEWFHLCEYLDNDLVMWLARIGDRYYEFHDTPRLTQADIANKLLELLP